MDINLYRFAVVIGAYWTVAISMVFVSKRLMTGSEIHSDISVLLVWLQNLISILCILIYYILSMALGKTWTGPVLNVEFLCLPDMIYGSITFTGTLIFNNLMLKYISVVFYQVARSLTLIFVITFSALFLKEKVTTPIVLSCVFIISGFYITVDVEMISQGVHFIGIVYGVLASLMAALCGVFFKRIQKIHNLGSMQLALNNSIVSCVALSPLVISSGQLQDFVYSSSVYNWTVWGLIILSGMISLVMGWISALQISVTSPLTHNISINAKSVFQTLLAVAWNGESRSNTWWIGNACVVVGIAAYTSNKLQILGKGANFEKRCEAPQPFLGQGRTNELKENGGLSKYA